MENVLYSRVIKNGKGKGKERAKIYLCHENNGYPIFFRNNGDDFVIGYFPPCQPNEAHEFAYKMGELTVDEILDGAWSGIHIYSPEIRQTADKEGEEWKDA